jgi:hypothetical protein
MAAVENRYSQGAVHKHYRSVLDEVLQRKQDQKSSWVKPKVAKTKAPAAKSSSRREVKAALEAKEPIKKRAINPGVSKNR